MRKLIYTFLYLVLISPVTQAADFMAVEGQLTDSSALNPIEGVSVDFKLEILDDTANDCILYVEDHINKNMTGTNGFFSLSLGQGTVVSGNYLNSINNGFNHTALSCSAGTTYNPALSSHRRLRISFDDGSGPETLVQMIDIATSQYANDAHRFDGKQASDFIQVNNGGPVLTQANLETIFASAGDVTGLRSLIDSGGGVPGANSVGAAEITDGSITGADLAASLITLSHLSSGAGNPGEVLSTTGSTLQWVVPSVAPSTVGTAEITDGTIQNADIANGTIAPIKMDPAGASAGHVLTYDGANPVWLMPLGDFSSNGAMPMTGNLNLNNNSLQNVTLGSVGSPSISFNADGDTGLFSSGAGNISLVSDGAAMVNIMSGSVNIPANLDVGGDVVANAYFSTNANPEIGATDYLLLDSDKDGDSTGGILFRIGGTPAEVMRIANNGHVGIANTTPVTKLDIGGAVRLAGSTVTCNASSEGAIRYDNTTNKFEVCDETSWNTLAPEKRCASGYVDVGEGNGKLCVRVFNGLSASSASSQCEGSSSGPGGLGRICSAAQIRSITLRDGGITFGANTLAGDVVWNGAAHYMLVDSGGVPTTTVSVVDGATDKDLLCCY